MRKLVHCLRTKIEYQKTSGIHDYECLKTIKKNPIIITVTDVKVLYPTK